MTNENENKTKNIPTRAQRPQRPRTKLTAAVVRVIRQRLLAGESHPAIAADYNVSEDAVFDIAHNRTWRQLDGGTPTDRLPPAYHPRGSGQGHARLTEAQVRTIRTLLAQGWSDAAVARAFTVSPDAIFDIRHRRCWAWLPWEDEPLEIKTRAAAGQ